MGITVSFFSNTSDNRCLTKDLTLINSCTCDVYEPCDRLNPILTLDGGTISNEDVNGIVSCNYCQIPEFGRSYFITNIVSERGKKVIINCHVDVLETYKDQIKECECIAARSSSNYNPYLTDSLRLANAYVENQYINIGNLGKPTRAILFTLGKPLLDMTSGGGE